MNALEIARSLREKLAQKGLAQTVVSKATGVHQSQISRFCNGDFVQRSQNLILVCDYAGVRLDQMPASTTGKELQMLFDKFVSEFDPTKHRALLALLKAALSLM